MKRRHAVLVGGMALLVVAAAGVAVVRHVESGGGCAGAVTATAAHSPFLGAAARASRPDARLDRLTAAATRWGLGTVVGGVGYDYQQWLQVAALPGPGSGAVAAWTRDDPDVTVLDPATLRARWAASVHVARSAWDAGRSSYDVVALPAHAAPTLTSMRIDDGHRGWCVTLGDRAVRSDEDVHTDVADSGAVVVAVPAADGRTRITSLTSHGRTRWSVRSVTGERADFLGSWAGDVVVGGDPVSSLADAATVRQDRGGTVVQALSAATGRTAWTWSVPARHRVSVLGVAGGRLVVADASAGTATRLVGLDRTGHVAWSRVPRGPQPFDPALAGDRVLVRTATSLASYDAATGAPQWHHPLVRIPQPFPYGFQLASAPALDADHFLLSGTTALHVLDLATGALRDLPLPTDGINTTYWPYALAVTPTAVAVATNTGGVLLRRR